MTDQTIADAPTVRPPPWFVPQMRDTLAVGSTLIFAFTLAAPMFAKTGITIDADLKGAVIMQWATVMGWYFGSSKSSAAKDATIAAAITGADPVKPE